MNRQSIMARSGAVESFAIPAISRRRLLAASAIAGAASSLAPRFLVAQRATRYHRQNLSAPGFPDCVLNSYKRAIAAMLELPPTDPRNWYREEPGGETDVGLTKDGVSEPKDMRRRVFHATGLAAPVLCFVLVACGQETSSLPGAEMTPMTLQAPRDPAENEVVWARIAPGRLPAGARIIVRTLDNEIIAAIAPFGKAEGDESSPHTIPVPQEAITDGEVKLVLEVLEETADEGRPPAPGEVQTVELFLMQVTD